MTRENTAQTVDPKLLEILVCPATKQPLAYDTQDMTLTCSQKTRLYKIEHAIPIMLIDATQTA